MIAIMDEVSVRDGGVNRFTLKMIAILAMAIDHIAWSFIPTSSVPGQVMHAIGRLTGPIMFFFIAEGYRHTRSVWKYLARLLLFTALSTLPFSFFETGSFTFYSFGVIYTLALGLLAIVCYDRIQNRILSWSAIIILCILSIWGDWAFFGVILCLLFHIFHTNFTGQLISAGVVTVSAFLLSFRNYVTSFAFSSISMQRGTEEAMRLGIVSNLFVVGIVLPVILLRFYNGKSGEKPWSRWFFYIFYPAHLLLLGFLKYYVF